MFEQQDTINVRSAAQNLFNYRRTNFDRVSNCWFQLASPPSVVLTTEWKWSGTELRKSKRFLMRRQRNRRMESRIFGSFAQLDLIQLASESDIMIGRTWLLHFAGKHQRHRSNADSNWPLRCCQMIVSQLMFKMNQPINNDINGKSNPIKCWRHNSFNTKTSPTISVRFLHYFQYSLFINY